MKVTFTDSMVQTLTQTSQKTLIVNQDEVEGVSDEYLDVTLIPTNVSESGSEPIVYTSLTNRGIDHFLSITGYSIPEIQSIKDKIQEREQNQLTSIVNFLTLESKLKGAIVPITLRDGLVGTDNEMFKNTYCIPLDVLFNTITPRGFRPVRVDTIKTTTRIPKQDYTNYLFLNKDISNMVTVFIDVSRGR